MKYILRTILKVNILQNNQLKKE